ncbi:MAG: MFS transporter, partial [Patulibacter sp.]|nr:MFS transporter [Patulibacter sp.]
MERDGDVRALWRQRDFRRYLFALAMSDLGNRMTIVALAFAVLDIRHTASAVGLVLGCGSVAFLVGLAVGGVLGDRFDRRRVMIACDLARLGTQGLTAALVFSGDARLWNLALLAALTEFGTGVFNPVSQGLAQSVVEERYYRAAAGVRAMAISAGEMIGPVIGGLIVAAASPAWGLAADALTFACSAVALSGIRVARRPRDTDEPEPSMFAQLVEGWAEFRARRWLWSAILAGGTIQFVWGAWGVLGPVVASNRLGGAAVWGAILTAMGAGAVVGATIATRARPERPLLLFTL